MKATAVEKMNSIKQNWNSKHALKLDALQGKERVKKSSEFKKNSHCCQATL